MKQQLILTAALALLLAACGGKDNDSKPGTTNPEPGGNTPTTETTAFTQGADISWVTEMEAAGQKFYNADGQETDCFRLMQELGMDAIRLRVWVDPKDGWSGKQDVVAKARRAHALGMDLMIDFHYSDSWADPGQQFKPAAWQGLSADELKTAIRNHTTDVLQALKAEGIKPRWVQVAEGQRCDTQVGTGGQRDTPGYAVGRRRCTERRHVRHTRMRREGAEQHQHRREVSQERE